MEQGQDGYYRSLHASPDNKGYEGEDEDDTPKYVDVEAANNNTQEYQTLDPPPLGTPHSGLKLYEIDAFISL